MKRTLILDLIISLVVVALLIFIPLPYVGNLLAIGIIVFYTYKSKGFKAELGFVKPANVWKTCLSAALIATGILITSYVVLRPLFEYLTGVSLSLGVFERIPGNTNLLLLSIGIGWVVGGFLEEIIFRGFLITRFGNLLPRKAGLIIGAILTSILFGYLHSYQGITGQLITGTVGFILAVVFILNKERIWLNILTHGFINTMFMLAMYYEVVKI